MTMPKPRVTLRVLNMQKMFFFLQNEWFAYRASIEKPYGVCACAAVIAVANGDYFDGCRWCTRVVCVCVLRGSVFPVLITLKALQLP